MKFGDRLSKISFVSLTNMMICAAGITVFALLLIFPAYRSLAKMERGIAAMKAEIERQELLSPAFYEMLKSLRQPRHIPLRLPERETLGIGQAEQALAMVRAAAERNGLDIDALAPDVASLSAASDFMKLQVTVAGSLPRMHDFLLELGSLPPLARIHQLELRSTPVADRLSLTSECWFAQGQTSG
jgi:hypothetical protein